MKDMRTCAKNGCGANATHALRIEVPATGYAWDQHQPIKMVMGLPLCEQHAVEARPVSFLNPELRQIISAAAYGKVPPDFNRMRLIPILLDGEEYKTFDLHQKLGRMAQGQTQAKH